ncbi:hypothetical protein [Tsuneonella sp. SYSU-LHT278]|uniref:hypothetical protein n=1 Tax=Tsuneonella sediminis TaxID=3416089 RepID=UPI003F7986E5
MLIVSSNSLAHFQEQGIRALRQRILVGWNERLASLAMSVGEAGRSAILDEIEFASRDDPDLTVGELQLLADLRLAAMFEEIEGARR